MRFTRTCLLIITFNIFASCTYMPSSEPLSPDHHVEPIARPQFTIPTPYPTTHQAIENEHTFTDDFACDADNGVIGWSNCNHIHSKYHGPFNNLIPNTIFRHFQCDASSISALISFSIVFDCNVAFTDTVLLSINNHTIAQYNAATQQDRLNDSSLLSISNCDWYVARNITSSIPLIDIHSFQLKFETIFKLNIDKNIAIFDIGMDCVKPKEPRTIVREDTLKCHRDYTNSNSKSNIDPLLTMKDNFIAFALQYTDPRITTELALSHFDGEDIKKNTYSDEWYWSIQLELSKKQILLQNKTTDAVIQTILPSTFRIKDEADCYLDTNHRNVFWNCETGNDGAILWSYNDDTKRLYASHDTALVTYLQWDPIYNESKVTRLYNESGSFYMVSANEFRYNSYRIADSGLCQLTKDAQPSVFTQTDGSTVAGYRAVFTCDGEGVNVKMEIAQLTGMDPNDWADLWIASFGNDNIQIGIGRVIGKQADVIFSFRYDDGVYTSDLQCAWISTLPFNVRTNWRFYDYYNDTVCNVPFMQKHHITRDMFNHVDAYSLYGSKAKYLPYYLWTNPYFIFELSSPMETWMRFKMTATEESIVVYFGKQNVRGICESKAEEESYYIVISIHEYYICSEYGDYRLSETWLFWIQWNEDHVLEIGNGAWMGQSVIARYDGFNAFGIESISIGCSEYEVCEWGFYTQQQQLVLLNTVFSPQSKLLFTYDYEDSMAQTMFSNQTSIDIYSYSLHLNYVIYIETHSVPSCMVCNRDSGDACVECKLNEIGGIVIHLPDYYHIAMHKAFDTEYEIWLSSSALLLQESTYRIQRNAFMNVSIEFSNELMIDETLKVSQLTIHNDFVTQNTSYIHIKSPILGIDAVLCIRYAIHTCVICDQTDAMHHKECVSCYDGISLGASYIHKRMDYNISFPPQYTLSIASSDTIVGTNKHKISIKNCGIGSGLILHDNNTRYKCMECPQHSINLFANDNECHACLQSNGYYCEASNIWIDYNYWLTIAPSSFEIVSSVCPPSYCCQHEHGCSYNATNTNRQVCALNRDPSVPLCGACLPGYTEVYGDTRCMHCSDDNYGYLLILLGCALLYVIAISCVFQEADGNSRRPPQYKKQSYASVAHEMQNFKCCTLILHDCIDALFVSLFHCITFFYQSMSYILMHSPGTQRVHFILPLLQLFSMDLSIKNAAFCFLSDLDALSKELWLLVIPFALVIATGILWMVLRCIAYTYGALRYAPNFKAMLWCLALVSFSTVANRLFNLLSCRQIGAATIHFIAPQYECFDGVWWMALVAILFMIISVSVLFCIVFQMDPQVRQEEEATITAPYTPGHWYWEFVILSRRLWTSALITFHYLNETQFNLMFAALLMCCLGCQLKFQPFKYNRINHMETICLLLLLLCFIVIHVSTDDLMIAVVVIPALLAPFLLFVSRIYSTIKLYVSIQSEDSKLNPDQQKILMAAIDRLPSSRRDIILAIIHKTMPYINIQTYMMQAHVEVAIESMENTLYIVTDMEETCTEEDGKEDGITMVLRTGGTGVGIDRDTITDFISKTGGVTVDTTPEDRTAILCSESTADHEKLSSSSIRTPNPLFVRNSASLPSLPDHNLVEMTQDGESESDRNQYENEYLLSTMAVGSRTETLTITQTLDCKIKKFSLSQSGDQQWMAFDDAYDDDAFLYQTQPTSASSY